MHLEIQGAGALDQCTPATVGRWRWYKLIQVSAPRLLQNLSNHPSTPPSPYPHLASSQPHQHTSTDVRSRCRDHNIRGGPLRHDRGDRSHLSAFEENTLNEYYNLTNLLLLNEINIESLLYDLMQRMLTLAWCATICNNNTFFHICNILNIPFNGALWLLYWLLWSNKYSFVL